MSDLCYKWNDSKYRADSRNQPINKDLEELPADHTKEA